MASSGRISEPMMQYSHRYSTNVSVIDNVPPEMLYLVDFYWYQFPPMEAMWYNILGVTITFLGMLSLTGNFLVFYIFVSTSSLRTPSNLFILNLAVSDFMMMLTMFPPMVINCYFRTWVLGPLMCEIYGMCGSLFGCVSIWTMTMIAFDRYNVIVKGITAKPLTILGAVLRILFVWVVCGIWTVLPLFGWNRYVPEGNMTACGTDYLSHSWKDKSYILVYGFWVYAVPLILIIFSYYHILKAVTAHEKAMKEQAKKMNVESLRSANDKNKSVEIKLAKVALCTISLWFMAWTPYSVINYIGVFNLGDLVPLGTIWGSVFAKANAVYNPIVYAISHPKYKAVLYKKFNCVIGKDDGISAEDQSQRTDVEKSVCDSSAL